MTGAGGYRTHRSTIRLSAAEPVDAGKGGGHHPQGTRAGHTCHAERKLGQEFESSSESIRNWVRQADRDGGEGEGGLSTEEHEELRRLRRDNKQLRIEREILSKAATWFAREADFGRACISLRIAAY
jgi:transposase